MGTCLAFDIGGANVKWAHGGGAAGCVAFELWKAPRDLAGVLTEITRASAPFDRVALTMTAELCDCFETRADGVRFVLGVFADIVPARATAVWGVDGQFHALEDALRNPLISASANWRAVAEAAARLVGPGHGVLIDVGSTTTDLIPLRDARAVPRALTDHERLTTGELVYAGVRRTPVCAIASRVRLRRRAIGLCAELFATLHDVYLILGHVPEDPNDTQTADGRPATRAMAHARLARMVGCDAHDLHADEVPDLARQLDELLIRRLLRSARRVTRALETTATAVIAGSGHWVASRVARRAGFTGSIDLDAVWGREQSVAACAVALLKLLEHDLVPR